MIRFVHVTGVYLFDDAWAAQRKHLWSEQERKEFLHAKTIGDAETVARLVEGTGLEGADAEAAQLPHLIGAVAGDGLREANLHLTRMGVRESVTPDLLVINTINTIEELDKVANSLAKRLREWYALYDPELEHAYQDHASFVDAMLTSTAGRPLNTMGAQLSEQDVEVMLAEARTLKDLYGQRQRLLEYLEMVMQQHMPNVKRVAGPTIGAKLLALAGSLERMSRMPSSTVQLLGAETALFRHLRNRRARPPKHGIIFNHALLQRAAKPMRGKVARTLADKISIAAKIDYFKGTFIGDKLYAEVEARVGR